MSEEQPIYAKESIIKEFEEWWTKNTNTGTIVILSANEYLHMKNVAQKSYIEGFYKGKMEKIWKREMVL